MERHEHDLEVRECHQTFQRRPEVFQVSRAPQPSARAGGHETTPRLEPGLMKQLQDILVPGRHQRICRIGDDGLDRRPHAHLVSQAGGIRVAPGDELGH
jgi:hypothetical protein